MAVTTPAVLKSKNPTEYQRRIRAWTMYDWANSAFATTVMAAVLPVYYSQVAGANLPSEAIATAYWSLGLSVSLFIVAILSPILGTVSDVMRGKKKFLAVFAGLGIVFTGLLVLVNTGDFILASVLFLLGRIGFTSANVFYDALLPHVAAEEDQDRVSTRGYAMGYLGGGLLLAVNIVMIFMLPGTWGPRLSFLSVAIWWAVFSIPVFTRIPEPPSASMAFEAGKSLLASTFGRLRETFKDMRRYRELFKMLLAFLIYNDGIGTIIGVAAIYGAELGFDSVALILALLLVQFVGIPFSLMFGALPSRDDHRRSFYLAFVLFNLVALPLSGFLGLNLLPGEISGAPLPPYEPTASAVGEGVVLAQSESFLLSGSWEETLVSGEVLEVGGVAGFLNDPFGGPIEDVLYVMGANPGDSLEINYVGQEVELTYSTGPNYGTWEVYLDGEPALDADGAAIRIDAYSEAVRYGVSESITAEAPGEHTLTLVNSAAANPDSSGTQLAISQVEVQPPARQNNLGAIIGLIFAVEAVGLLLAWLLGKRLFTGLADSFNTKRSIYLALVIYCVIAVWGFFLNSTVEFWFLAWMVAVVQGGSQALSRSLYASMSPAAKSGEFFGLFGVMEKFASLIGPLLFAAAGLAFGSSRPAILSLIALFVIGMILLARVDVVEGRRVAKEEDAEYLRAHASEG
ncbi:MAG: MFS transporter [Anaerolineales bacterium]|nr:MFS transporter [Anaerolineales bacterium]